MHCIVEKMKDSPDLSADASERARRNAHLARLEADLAYFQARLEILGEPRTANQIAQRKVFKRLHKALGEMILQVKRRAIEEKYR